MSQDHYERLRAAMSDIAEAVGRFTSEQIQMRAYDDLVRSLGVGVPLVSSPKDDGPSVEEAEVAPHPPNTTTNGADARSASRTAKRRTRGSNGGKAWAPKNDFNWRPQGKQPLREFVEEKQPRGNYERNTVAVFWLSEIAGASPVDVGHVIAAYRECGWKLPNDIANSLSVTGSRKSLLLTSDRAALKLTPTGDNLVRYDLPRPAKSKK